MGLKKSLLKLMLISTAIFASNVVQASEMVEIPQPIAIRNNSPFISIFAIPEAQGIKLTPKRQFDLSLTLEQTSHFNISDRGEESIEIDGETSRLSLQVHYGLNKHWQLGFNIPVIKHGGGFLDGFIINWHDFWGFPQNGRTESPRDAIRFHYRREENTLIDIDSGVSGIGDITLSASRKLPIDLFEGLALHAQLKLPSGEPSKLTGSGAMDLGLSLAGAKRWHKRLTSNFRVGVAYLGRGDILSDSQKNWVGVGGADLSFQLTPKLFFNMQFDAHTPIYTDSTLNELKDWSGMLTTGGTWHLSKKWWVNFAVVENVPNADIASDVSFYIRLGMSNRD